MIAEFSIENFFSIKSVQKISFEPSADTFMSDEYSYEVKDGVRLLKVGFIYGANASGKTNILNAIEFFKMLVLRMPKDRTEKTGVVPFMLDDTSRNEKTKMSMVFYINQSKYILSFELDVKHIYSETLIVYDSIRPTKLYNRSYDTTTDSSTIDFGVNLKMTKKSQDVISGNTINNCSVLAAFGKSNVERTRLNDVYDYFAKQVKDVLAPGMLLSGYVKSRLDKDEAGDLKKFILNFLKASDFNIEDVVLHEEEELITPELEQLIQNAPIDKDAKAEMLRKGKITNTELTFKHKAGDKVYDLSEEYESNGTMRFLGNSNGTSQMLLTTHDINLLNEDFIRRDTIWFTDKDELGETKIVRLSSLGLHKNLSPYNAYKQGKLVKLPFLGSQYINLND